MRPAIQVDKLSKTYWLGQRGESYRTLRESLTGAAAGLWRGVKRVGSRLLGAGRAEEGAEPGEFWALKDVSFEVQPGEVVGIIGRNGAGKSTLLKILSRIVEPSAGRAELRGRLGSLLEVGTGFHPELTGRENIYLNGSILGMSRREVARKFDEIVAFSEVEQFLDTPVKRYSSGMYVRLAFAVAAHLEPEILIVDEVLAVGDVGFQQKCLGKMSTIPRSGRTVLFVSHNMAAIRTLCNQVISLEKGRIVHQGSVEKGVEQYLRIPRNSCVTVTQFTRPSSRESAWVRNARLISDGPEPGHLELGDRLAVEVEFEADVPLARPQLGVVIATANGDNLVNANTHYQQAEYPTTPVRRGRIRCDFGMVPLMPGRYVVSLWFGTQHVDTHTARDALCFEVCEKDYWGNGKVPPSNASFLWWPVKFTAEAIDGESERGSL